MFSNLLALLFLLKLAKQLNNYLHFVSYLEITKLFLDALFLN